MNAGSLILGPSPNVYSENNKDLNLLEDNNAKFNRYLKLFAALGIIASSPTQTTFAKDSTSSFETSLIKSEAQIFNILVSNYELINSDEIKFYLGTNYYLYDKLNELRYELEKQFGLLNYKLILESDYEISNWKSLVVKIPSENKDNNGRLKILKIIKNWLVFQPKEFKSLINLSLESHEI